MSIINAIWSGGSFRLSEASREEHRRKLREGEHYVLTVFRDRDWRFHRQYFARVRELWETLPEGDANAPWGRSADHLRKWALVSIGCCTMSTIHVQGGGDQQARVVANQVCEAMGEFAVILPGDEPGVMMIARPKSQALSSMKADEFRESARAVLEWLTVFVQTTRGQA
ncbi:MAG: hypothetical protein AAF416_15585 [Pseudomonadota bacterium]